MSIGNRQRSKLRFGEMLLPHLGDCWRLLAIRKSGEIGDNLQAQDSEDFDRLEQAILDRAFRGEL